uniref:cAMP-responsive element-binding protein-like 2 n=1 Tax=Lepeophtheirus salmonis TaxID=72036 RepID=C1BUF6_LEPSM|nr:cAMP-responsive element-binding protein-like 2 [Lepeophtheirus salmonis]
MAFVNPSSSTVNFEDLFDFSPETSTQHQIHLPDPFDSSSYQLPVKNPNFSNSQPAALSSSLPSNWKEVGFHSKGVRELLEDRPEVITESYSSSLREESALLTSSQPVATRSKRGRKPGQKNLITDMKSKLERSRQSARECRARKKLRYQYLDDLILERDKANVSLREELYNYQKWCHEIDKGNIPEELEEFLRQEASGGS